jgi:cytosine/uracil/thiamine/allantoin permease
MTMTTMSGTHIAFIMNVLRRITALLAMIAIVGLLLLLIWQVELHHEHGSATDEPAVVALSSRAA